MRRCFYHTDLVQNAVVHNFSRQLAFIEFRTIKALVDFKRNHSKNFQNHLYGQLVPTFDKRKICKEIFRVTLPHDKGFIVYFLLMVL